LLAGMNAARYLRGLPLMEMPTTTMLGALCHYITHAEMQDFQPMKANFGIIPPITPAIKMGKHERALAARERSLRDLAQTIQQNQLFYT